MARFYQTAERDFQDDFIFQPNWELAKLSMDKIEGDRMREAESLNILGNATFDYNRAVDYDLAKEVKQSWEDLIKDATDQISKHPMDTNKNKKIIAEAEKKIRKDFEDGPVYKMMQNKKIIDDWTGKVEKLELASDRDLYPTLLNSYIQQAGGRGSESGLFSSPELYKSSGYQFSDFIKSDYFKQLEADEKGTITMSPSGQWLIKRGNQIGVLEESKIQRAYQGYALDNPDVLGRAAIGTQYFGENNWFDENGNLSFAPGSVLGDSMRRGSEAMAYSKTNTSQELTADPYRLKDYDFAIWKKQQQYGEEEVLKLAMGNLDVAGFTNKNQYAKGIEQNFLKEMKSSLLSTLGLNSPLGQTTQKMFEEVEALNSLDSFMDYTKKNGLMELYKEAEGKKQRMKEEQRAGYAHLVANGIDPKEVVNLEKGLNNMFQKYSGDFTYKIEDEMIFNTADGKTVNLSKELGDGKHGKGWKPAELGGKIINYPGKGRIMITGYAPVENSVNIIPINAPEKTGKPLTENYFVGSMKFSYKPVRQDGTIIESEYADETFDLRVYSDMAESLGVDN